LGPWDLQISAKKSSQNSRNLLQFLDVFLLKCIEHVPERDQRDHHPQNAGKAEDVVACSCNTWLIWMDTRSMKNGGHDMLTCW